MRVIVTGGSGRAGRYTVKELADAGHEVINVDRMRPSTALPGGFIQIDLTDAGEVYDVFAQVRPEGVCHLAANPSPSGYSRQGTFQNNVMSTYNMMQAAGDFGVGRFIYASSEMATGWLTTEDLPPRFPFNEADRVESPNAYALSKYMGEVIATSLITRYPGMSICSLRINNVIPPDEYHRLEARRRNFPSEGSSNFWSYIDARDVAGAFRPWKAKAAATKSSSSPPPTPASMSPFKRRWKPATAPAPTSPRPRTTPVGVRLQQDQRVFWLGSEV
ncbi:MAG: NAD(P)-dependent oxidoreductase [Caldilineaceae bacterium]